MLRNFKQNNQAVKYGNHASNVDAAYCTTCKHDIQHPLFDWHGDCPGINACPHVHIEWMEGDIVTTIDEDRSLGPARIVSTLPDTLGNEDKRAVVLDYYTRDNTPVYRIVHRKDLLAWEEPAKAEEKKEEVVPIDMVLFCPNCGTQHIDEPTQTWDNPPHRSHLCACCEIIWRPADVATNGVAAPQTQGKADTWQWTSSFYFRKRIATILYPWHETLKREF